MGGAGRGPLDNEPHTKYFFSPFRISRTGEGVAGLSRPADGLATSLSATSTAGDVSASALSGSCCSSLSHSPCGSSCQDRPNYLNIKPMYVRELRQEKCALKRQQDSSCSPNDQVHQQLLDILHTASKLPPPSPISCLKRPYSFEHCYDNPESSDSSPDESYKGKPIPPIFI